MPLSEVESLWKLDPGGPQVRTREQQRSPASRALFLKYLIIGLSSTETYMGPFDRRIKSRHLARPCPSDRNPPWLPRFLLSSPVPCVQPVGISRCSTITQALSCLCAVLMPVSAWDPFLTLSTQWVPTRTWRQNLTWFPLWYFLFPATPRHHSL